jgi:YD repeat-containing protein
VVRVAAIVALMVLAVAAGSVSAATATRTSAFAYEASGLLIQETIEPDHPNLCVTTIYTYDAYGNRTGATTQNCAGASGEAVIEPRTSVTAFTPDGRFATSATNALGHSETRAFDPRFGGITSLTGPNGLTTTWHYDGFGRKTRETRADGTVTELEYLYCAGTAGGSAA